tara:strand:+ start:772 stop:1329 length:558 start_codon:yes stop_codon:yes gene_type:complete
MTTKKKVKPSDVGIVDNWLELEDFIKLTALFKDPDCPWYRSEGISDLEGTMDLINPLDNYMFAHMVYNMHQPQSSYWTETFKILHKAMKKSLGHDYRCIQRVKVNLYPRTAQVQTHPFHTDTTEVQGQRGLLLCFNTCDGYTGFADGTEVDSIENRAIFFDSTERHHSTSCSNASYRMNMNVNYV